MNEFNQTIIKYTKDFNLIFCEYNILYEKVNYKYKLVDDNKNPVLKICGYKKVNYQYDFEKHQLK